MQFIAEDPIHVVIRTEEPALIDAATRQVVKQKQRRLFAKFKRGTAPGWAQKAALDGGFFELRKMPESGVTPGQWLAFYDSREAQAELGWTDEERAAIEEKLASHHSCMPVELPKLLPPWPRYDALVASKGGLSNQAVVAKIVEKVTEDGYDAADVAAYERQERARKSVLDALDELTPAEPATEDGAQSEVEEVVEA